MASNYIYPATFQYNEKSFLMPHKNKSATLGTYVIFPQQIQDKNLCLYQSFTRSFQYIFSWILLNPVGLVVHKWHRTVNTPIWIAWHSTKFNPSNIIRLALLGAQKKKINVQKRIKFPLLWSDLKGRTSGRCMLKPEEFFIAAWKLGIAF